MVEDDIVDVIHVYSPLTNHADARIVGDRRALEKLRDAVICALDEGKGIAAEVYCSDGEGYEVKVTLDDSPWEEWKLEPFYLSEETSKASWEETEIIRAALSLARTREEQLTKLFEPARRAWVLLDVVEPNAPETEALFTALSAIGEDPGGAQT